MSLRHPVQVQRRYLHICIYIYMYDLCIYLFRCIHTRMLPTHATLQYKCNLDIYIYMCVDLIRIYANMRVYTQECRLLAQFCAPVCKLKIYIFVYVTHMYIYE